MESFQKRLHPLPQKTSPPTGGTLTTIADHLQSHPACLPVCLSGARQKSDGLAILFFCGLCLKV
jgi:hypothetical protein